MLPILLIGIPLLAALMIFISKGNGAKYLALGFSVVTFVVSIVALVTYWYTPESSMLEFNVTWVKSMGINFDVSISALSILMVLLTTFLTPIIILTSFRKDSGLARNFYALMMIFEMAVIGVFMTNDGFLFYVFWELSLIPLLLICLFWGGENRVKITMKFFIYTLVGSLFMLIGLIFLYTNTDVEGLKSWNVYDLYAAGKSMSAVEQGIVFWFIFIAFAIKMPVFPFHTWQPDTYSNAPIQATMLLSGIMLKMATFGAIKWLLPMVPLGVDQWGNFAMILMVIGVVYASIIAIGQNEFKRFVAYSSIAHVGIIGAAIFSMNFQGIQGSLMLMLAHGVNAVGLFFIAEILLRKTGTTDISKMGGIRALNGNFATYAIIIVLGTIALPLTNGFVGEFVSFCGIYGYNPIMAGIAGTSVIFGAVYMLRNYQKIMLGENTIAGFTFGKLETSEVVVLVVLCATIILMGVYPAPLNEIAETATKEILVYIK